MLYICNKNSSNKVVECMYICICVSIYLYINVVTFSITTDKDMRRCLYTKFVNKYIAFYISTYVYINFLNVYGMYLHVCIYVSK